MPENHASESEAFSYQNIMKKLDSKQITLVLAISYLISIFGLTFVLILNFAYPGGGKIISDFIDSQGCNTLAFWTSSLQSIIVPVILIGFIWGVWQMWSNLGTIRAGEKEVNSTLKGSEDT